MPLLIDEGCAALPLYVAGKMAYPYLRGLLRKWWLVVLGAAALCAFMAHGVRFTIVPQSNGDYSPYYLLVMPLLLLSFVPFLWTAEKLDGVKWLRALGVSSLGIMLLHAPMCHTAAVVLNRVFEKGSAGWVASFLVAYAAIVALSWWLTALIEKYCPVLLGKRKL